MSKIIYLTGDVKWAKIRVPDQEYQKYSLDLYMDEHSWDKFKVSGAQLKTRTDKEGKSFVTFRRPVSILRSDGSVNVMGPPDLLNAEGEPYTGTAEVGNGSNVTIKIEVYDTMKGKGTRLERVRINKLVAYTPPQVDTDIDEPF